MSTAELTGIRASFASPFATCVVNGVSQRPDRSAQDGFSRPLLLNWCEEDADIVIDGLRCRLTPARPEAADRVRKEAALVGRRVGPVFDASAYACCLLKDDPAHPVVTKKVPSGFEGALEDVTNRYLQAMRETGGGTAARDRFFADALRGERDPMKREVIRLYFRLANCGR